MVGAFLCTLAFFGCYLAGARSIGHGLGLVMFWGYFYGIVRANLLDTTSQFTFDIASVALYLAVLLQPPSAPVRNEVRRMGKWLTILIGWPALLCLIPRESPLIELCGFRFCAFFLPFLLIGTRLTRKDLTITAQWLAILNLVALAFALAEYLQGVDRFFPRNVLTKVIYVSTAGQSGRLRIPATFAHAHAFGGAMVCSIPFLIEPYLSSRRRLWQIVLAGGVVAGCLGILMSATRSNVIVGVGALALLLIRHPALLANKAVLTLALAGGIAVAYSIANGDDRIRRFEELGDTNMVIQRVGTPDHHLQNVFEAVLKYPIGNGLACAFGVSVPYFLQDPAVQRTIIGAESEFVRIAVTQGIIGIFVWLLFFTWVLTRRLCVESQRNTAALKFMHSLCLLVIASGIAGVGCLSGVPAGPMLFVMMGVVSRGWLTEERRNAVLELPPRMEKKVAASSPVPAHQGRRLRV